MTEPCIPGLFSPVLRQMADTSPEPHPVAQERKRLNAAALRVLAALKAAGERGMTNVELSQPEIGGLGGVRRTWDLRQDGWDIAVTKEHGGIHRYTLRGYR